MRWAWASLRRTPSLGLAHAGGAKSEKTIPREPQPTMTSFAGKRMPSCAPRTHDRAVMVAVPVSVHEDLGALEGETLVQSLGHGVVDVAENLPVSDFPAAGKQVAHGQPVKRNSGLLLVFPRSPGICGPRRYWRRAIAGNPEGRRRDRSQRAEPPAAPEL